LPKVLNHRLVLPSLHLDLQTRDLIMTLRIYLEMIEFTVH
jgi:hypothetical protein